MIPRTSTDIYLDANATTRVLPQAARAAQNAMEELFGNPSSSHITGLRSRYILESTRELAQSVLGAGEGRIVFTSGATEAIQTAVFSVLCRIKEERAGAENSDDRFLLYGATEHKAVPEALNHWNRMLGINAQVLAIPVDQQGMLDLEFLREHVDAADLVCTMAVNNETGVIHDLVAIEEIIRESNPEVPWLVDMVQALGKSEIQLARTTIDYATISGHKLHAPKGIGLLYVREGAALTALFAGGGQERGARSGTENLPGVAALGEVFRCLQDTDSLTFQDTDTLTGYRDRLVASLRKAFPPIVFNTPFDRAVPTTINLSIRGFTSKEILDLFDAAGIRVSSGSACGSALKGSYVLEAMGLPKWRSEGAVRVSFSPTISDVEITAACSRIEEAGQALRGSCLIVSDHRKTGSEPALDGLIQLKKGSMCSWVLIDSATRNCIIIDPFDDLCDRMESLIRCQNARVLAILDTHKHVDHDSPREVFLKILSDYADERAFTRDILGWPEKAAGCVRLGDGSTAGFLRVSDDLIIARTELPGHTVVGRAYLVGTMTEDGELRPEDVQFAFTGDTIQIGGIGRTDFPSSSVPDMYSSLRKLPRIISETTVICPTHDYSNHFSTTLAAEKRENEFLARILDPIAPMTLEEFTRQKAQIDSEIDDSASGELICGRICLHASSGSSIDVHPDELEEFLARHRDSLMVDVREPHEYSLTTNWAALGFDQPPRNVPLTRLSEFVQHLLNNGHSAERDTIFVCRSGNRSGKAAEVFRRLGLANTWHIAGGMALGGARHENVEEEEDEYYII